MNARRWIAAALLALVAGTGACSGGTPTGFAADDPRVQPPEAPTDTSVFVPEDMPDVGG